MSDFLKEEYFNNTVQDYIIALGIILVGFIAVRIFRGIILKRLKKWSASTETKFDDLLVQTIERFGLPALNFLVIYWGINSLDLSPGIMRIVEIATAAVIAFFIIRLVSTTVQYSLETRVRKLENGEEKVKQMTGVMLILNMVIWGIGLIFFFDNLGYDVTAIIAGLGIGGIAIALAAQNILGDLFNYFVIFFDRPFEIGDFIVVDDKKGNVEYIGIKTTRIKSLSGEQLVFSNSDLTKSRIHNFKKLQRRRIVFTVGVTYQTTKDQLVEIPQLMKTAIEEAGTTTFDRAHFATFGNFSLNFEAVYFVESAEYNIYMDVQQKINVSLFEAFEKRGIDFAYPTQTIFMEGPSLNAERQNSKS
ncbi:MAG TPA: mechanosensitive ion channel domain-containing protein [Cyclobacteriaceae bacterium]|nr:mechanosensitive ion channel domain-containing protein [Cyclobacteriaceae bacterium]